MHHDRPLSRLPKCPVCINSGSSKFIGLLDVVVYIYNPGYLGLWSRAAPEQKHKTLFKNN
jgi:hypothetical protein